MLTVEPRSLLRKLNATCTRAFETAAGACLTNRHYEVTAEHLLLALIDDADSDIRAAFEQLNIDVDTARTAVQRSIADLRTGNAGKPVFSSLLLEWVQEAWLHGSIELGQFQLRSISLFVRLALTPMRYVATTWSWLDSFDKEKLRKDALLIASRSNEAMAAAANEAPAGGPTMPGSGEQTALGRFTSDLTERARKGDLDPVFGREREIRQMIEILVRRRKNNPIIVGEAGVGKTALVEGLALRIVENKVPAELAKAKVVSLDLGQLQAGAGVKGEFENRLKAVLNEIKASPTPILLFIDEAHTLIGAGGAQGTGDAANLLKPALARGELRTIAATTYAEFKKYFEKDAALERRFQPVRVEEPSPEGAIVMLRGLAAEFQRVHQVTIQDSAVVAAVELSSRYISGRQLPDKAVDLLDTSAAFVKLVRAAPPPELEDAEAKLQALDREIAALDSDAQAGLPLNVEARARAVEER
ncbi:MAG TPA: Clp protease N-terminal domain-containing protein, partial [Polyangiaceae bacterium]|nr:Clp protease N-terminal domain-containing protein [Polyangiaceae bacterium]